MIFGKLRVFFCFLPHLLAMYNNLLYLCTVLYLCVKNNKNTKINGTTDSKETE